MDCCTFIFISGLIIIVAASIGAAVVITLQEIKYRHGIGWLFHLFAWFVFIILYISIVCNCYL